MVYNRDTGLRAMQEIDHAVVADRAYFDDVTYASGGAMLRMFEGMLGTDQFFNTLTNYLNKNKYGNADENTLITEFGLAQNGKNICGTIDVQTIISDYLKNPGYPIIEVDISGGQYQFTQIASGWVSNSTWVIPIFAYNLRTQEKTVGYLTENQSICPDNWLSTTESYLFNYKAMTYARFRYSQTMWDRILKTDMKTIDDSTLFGLILDAIDTDRAK